MDSEFEEFEQELDDLDNALDDFELEFGDLDPEMELMPPEIASIEFTAVNVRTAVLSKNDMIALLCLKTADQGGAICRVDPRESNPAVQIYDDPEKALEWYSKSLVTSRQNGWSIVYDGLPLEG